MAAREKRPDVPGGRQVSYRIRLCDTEAEALDRRAERQGVSVARLLIELALTGREPSENRAVASELAVIRRQLAGATSNLNQAVRALHMNGRSGQLAECLTDVRAAVRLLDRVAR